MCKQTVDITTFACAMCSNLYVEQIAFPLAAWVRWLQWKIIATPSVSLDPLHCWLLPKCSLFGFRSNSNASRCSTLVLDVPLPSSCS